ncbi:hypothetical protein CBM2610_A120197 [Cupriavidus taiwanensis]|nr:hypothetical protein CBM2610_A120197 [Cupriavidus taiwanensis]
MAPWPRPRQPAGIVARAGHAGARLACILLQRAPFRVLWPGVPQGPHVYRHALRTNPDP